MSQIVLASPYPLQSRRGNSVSALRIAEILRTLGHAVQAISGRQASPAEGEVLVALHARKSAAAIRGFHARNPTRPIIVMLTGSDLYGDLPNGGADARAVRDTLNLASFITVSQGRSLGDIPDSFRGKARVIPKSLDLAPPPRSVGNASGVLQVFLASHLRPAKAPDLVLDALAEIPADIPLRVEHAGDAEDESLAKKAAEATRQPNSRYRWLGSLTRTESLAKLAAADLALNTSRIEGGANALCEAIQIGVPCVATAIPPNVGMLGPDHPGLFPVEDASALAAQLTRATQDPAYRQALADATVGRAPLFTREAEMAAWRAVLAEALGTPIG